MTNENKNIKITIIGGGLAGFSVGITLLKNGFTNIIVHERDVCMENRRQGYGLTILQGVSALKRMGVFEKVKHMDTPSRSHFIFKSDGSIIGFFGTVFWPLPETNSAKSSSKHNLHIGRQDLRKILMDEFIALHPLGEMGIRWNNKLVKISQNSVHFENETCSDVDLVIGCDGINSIARKFKYRIDNSLTYLGIMVVLGITGCEHFLGKNRVFQTVDGCTRLFVMPFSTNPSESIMWQLSFPLEESEAKLLKQNNTLLKQHVMERCHGWHEPVHKIIESTSLDLIMGIPAFDRDPVLSNDLAENVHVPIGLLGDAAHPMSPFKGQGANQALLDAVLLADSISSNSCIKEAIDFYEKTMINRVKSKVIQSRDRVTLYHQSDVASTSSFLNRGVDEKLLESLNSRNINANYQGDLSIEDAIKDEMKSFNII